MDSMLTAAILSVVEGLTEFLPVSSSGHLILTGEILGYVGEKAATFEVVIQLGAILAVVVLYWGRFWGLLRPKANVRFSGMRGIMFLMLTSLPACVLGLLAHGVIKHYLFNPASVAAALAVGAVVMIAVEKWQQKPTHEERILTLDEMTPKLALGIGCFQCLALWPGFSRSASTIMGGMILGAHRKLAAEYSFIAAVPIMVAATGYDLLKSWHLFTMADFPFFAVGTIGAFISALAAVKLFIAAVGRITLIPFAVYRLILAPLVYWFMLV